MRELPILMNARMVRAVLEGRKTQTRRPVKPQDCVEPMPEDDGVGNWVHRPDLGHPCDYACTTSPFSSCPFGVFGDRLWVRETFAEYPSDGDFIYRADFMAGDVVSHLGKRLRWSPSIHMPRRASRIMLQVDQVWVERVRRISGFNASREGIAGEFAAMRLAGFEHLWDSMYAKRGLGWDANPWVWVVSFKVVQ